MLFLVAWTLTLGSMVAVHFMLKGGVDGQTFLGLGLAFIGFAALFAGVELPLLLLLRRWKKKTLTGRWYALAAVTCTIIPVALVAFTRAHDVAVLIGWCFAAAVFGVVVGNGFYRGYDCGADRR